MKKIQITTIFNIALFGVIWGCSSAESFKPDMRDISTKGMAKDTAFSLPYEAVRETDWKYDLDAQESSQNGKVVPGTKIFFSDTYKGNGMWIPAQFEDGTLRWVKPQDFMKK